ncbi:ABC transporter substrate-binding protein [Mesorhizobium sp. A623]
MKPGTLAAFVTAAMLMGFGPAAAKDKLRLGTEGAYPPFNFIQANGQISGFDVEIGLALCKQMDVECEVIAQDWDGIVPGLIAKKYDFIAASMSITDQRKEKVAFTDPYYRSGFALVAPKDSPITDVSPDALAGKVIGAQAGTTQGEYMSHTFTKSDLKMYPTQEEVNLDLMNGRLDLQVSDYLPMLDWLKNSPDGACCKFVGKPVTDPEFVGEGIAIALRKEDNELRENMNAALKAIRADGTYQAISNKYFSTDIFTFD